MILSLFLYYRTDYKPKALADKQWVNWKKKRLATLHLDCLWFTRNVYFPSQLTFQCLENLILDLVTRKRKQL